MYMIPRGYAFLFCVVVVVCLFFLAKLMFIILLFFCCVLQLWVCGLHDLFAAVDLFFFVFTVHVDDASGLSYFFCVVVIVFIIFLRNSHIHDISGNFPAIE